MATVSTDGPGIDMSEIFAPFYWGFVVSLFLGGVTIVQAYMYFPHPTDRTMVQILAVIMLVLDLVSSGLVAQSLYYYLIPHYGSLSQLSSVTPELSAECLVSTVITFISQMYFVFQIYSLNHAGKAAWTLIVVITVSAVFAFVGGIGCVTAMYIFHHGVLSNRNDKFAIFFGIAKGFGALTDIMATTVMCYRLSGSKTGIKQTNGLIKSLIRFVVNRGALVTMIQTLLLITFYAVPNKLYWLAFHINVTRLYANTFFAMLNARENLKRRHIGAKTATQASSSYNISSQTHEYATDHDYDQAFHMPTITKSVVISDL